MKIEEIERRALELPMEDRALLAASLWESLEDPFRFAVDRSEEESLSLAIERDAEIETGKVAPLSHSEHERRHPSFGMRRR